MNGNGEDEYRRAGNAALKTRGSVESEVGPENAYRKVLVSDMRAILKDRPGHKGKNGEKLFKVYKIFKETRCLPPFIFQTLTLAAASNRIYNLKYQTSIKLRFQRYS